MKVKLIIKDITENYVTLAEFKGETYFGTEYTLKPGDELEFIITPKFEQSCITNIIISKKN